ncbi:MAG: ABC transporter permease subunit, partial [Actinobacteria bacterium]|nr:ABC transporter permease subunit [Actinomycetota bacterium]
MKRYADYFGLLPLLAFIVAFLGLPLVAITRFSLQDSKGNFTLNNFSTITSGIYRDAFWLSFQLSVLSAAISLILGFVFALAVTRLPIPILKGLISTASGVFANTGGVPLAFMFVASLGTYGLLTDWLRKIGVDLYANSWTLYSFSGLLIVYLYFQVPLMILVSLPIIEGIKREWREAALTLGAPYSFFWRKVIAPIIAPQLLATFLLLFTNSFAAYATAAALTSGTLALVPVQIASLIASNVQVDGANTA